MLRTEFEALRDLPDKTIVGDIKFARSRATSPLVIAENIRIANAHGVDARLSIHYNPQVGSKTFNVHVPGLGPICRLDVDGPPHRPAGRSHKHALQGERCPDRNLPDGVTDCPDLAGRSVRELFADFCRMAQISHRGNLEAPDEGTGDFMSTLDDIRANLRSRALVAGVDQLPSGHIRIETTFRYPDGGSIELFVVDPPRLLSDLGQTTAWLLDMQIKPWLSKKRQAMVEDVLHVYGVRQNGGAIEVDLPSLDELETKVLVLAQVCLRLADLTFTRRASLQAAFSDDLEEVLADADLEYEPNVELPGRFGSKVRVDYLVHGPRRSALMGWSSGSSSQAHVLANEIFRKWYDLDVPGRNDRRITVLDDRYDVYRPEDLERLSNFSDLLPLSDKKTLGDALAA